MTSGGIRAAIANTSPLVWRIAIAALIAAVILLAVRLPQLPASASSHRAYNAATAADALPPLPPLPPLEEPTGEALSADDARLSNAALPIAEAAPDAAAPFRFTGDETARLRARDCLAVAALYEAGDDLPGERAVVQVVLNRVRHPAFPASVCAVVFQGSERETGCQFTFTCDGALTRPPSPAALTRARAVAQAALAGSVDAKVGLATHYHADYVVPYWRDGLVKVAQQGAHLFYRWPGYWGSAAAMHRKSRSATEPAMPAIMALSDPHAPAIALDLALEAPPLIQIAQQTPATTVAPTPKRPVDATHEIALDPSAAPGSFALKALNICGRTADCRVAGHVQQDLAFLYIRHGGGEGVYWDCSRFQRNDRSQCLPGGAALDRLLAAS